MMHTFWPFPTPQIPENILALLKEFAAWTRTAVEISYWTGVKDGVTFTLIVVLTLYVFFARERQ